MAQTLSCLIFVSLVVVPFILARRKWSSVAVGFTTGAIVTLFVELYDIVQNGIDYGPLQIGPVVYLLRYATGVAVVGVVVWASVAGIRKLAAPKRASPPAQEPDTSKPGDSSPKTM